MSLWLPSRSRWKHTHLHCKYPDVVWQVFVDGSRILYSLKVCNNGTATTSKSTRDGLTSQRLASCMTNYSNKHFTAAMSIK